MIAKKDIELRYCDTDQMGVIYNANYFTYFMQGREKFAHDLGYDYLDFEESGYMFPVREASCSFLKSIRLNEKIFVETSIHKISKIKVEYYHEIKNEQGELKAKGFTTVVCVSIESGIPTRMDSVMPEIYNSYLEASKKGE